jgi:Flp pilus assembly protein TadG
METALVFFVGQTLETAGSDSARLIMTGQAQAKGLSKDTFKDAVCDNIKTFGLFDCIAGLAVDVQKYSQFSDINLSTLPLDEDGKLKTDGFVYQPGGPGDIVVVRIMYQWPVYVSLLGLNLSDMAGGKRLLMSTSSFRNEPYL